MAVAAVAIAAVVWVLTRDDGPARQEGSPTPGPTGTPLFLDSVGRGTDGDLRFVANSLQCGLENVITADVRLAADGQFCLVDLHVTNTGAEPLEWPIECQYLGLPDGLRIPSRAEATLLDPGSVAAFEAPLEPGRRYAEVGLIFDIPAETAPTALELHAACDSPGLVIET